MDALRGAQRTAVDRHRQHKLEELRGGEHLGPEKGWDTLAEHYSRDPTGNIELKTWMSIAIALRERYEDGLLHALPPTPLK